MRYWLLAIGTLLIAAGFALTSPLRSSSAPYVMRGKTGYTARSGEYRSVGIGLLSVGVVLLIVGYVRKRA